MRVALVHDNLWQVGGAERVLQALRALFPQAPVFTLGVCADARRFLGEADIRPSFLQRLPLRADRLRWLAPLFPVAIESLDLRSYDLVVSSSWGFAKAVRTRAGAHHICYCHSPLNWAWETRSYMCGEEVPPWARAMLRALSRSFRRWDCRTAQRVTQFIANSDYTARRISQYYRREATVIPPPVDLGFWKPTRPMERFGVVVSRLVPHKRIELAVEAFARLDAPLYVIGDGRDRRRLEGLAGTNVHFLGWVKDETVRDLLSAARLALVPGTEDFGLVLIEALACGTPVVAYGAGGALEVVAHGENGWIVPRQEVSDFAEAAAAALDQRLPLEPLRAAVEQYSLSSFTGRMQRLLSQVSAPACR